MSNLSRFFISLTLLVCAVYVASIPAPGTYKWVYVDASGIHFEKTAPSVAKRQGGYHQPQPGHNNYDPGEIIEILLEREAQLFCSEFLHIFPYAATSTHFATQITSKTLATVTATSTATTNLGTTTITDTSTEVDSTTATATVTDTTTLTSTSTETDYTTTTTYLYTAPGAGNARKRGMPVWLPFPSNAVSSACSQIVHPQTKQVYKSTLVTATETATDTAFTTSTIPRQTSTDFTTTTTTTTLQTTTTLVQSTTVPATATTTIDVIATLCAQSSSVDGGGITTDGELNFFSSPGTSDACCRVCYTTPGCGLWFFFPGFGCFNGVNTTGPNPTTQCPTGFGTYAIITGSGPSDPNVGGPGPCNGGFNYD